MHIGVPKEIKIHEYRVGLTPISVKEVVSHGHQVMVQAGAGLGIGMSDEEIEPFVDAFEHGERDAAKKLFLTCKPA